MKKLFMSSTLAEGDLETIKKNLLPLYRSKTESKHYNENASPITQFVCQLLGISNAPLIPKKPARPTHHKSKSTTSITKSPVFSFYPQPIITTVSQEDVLDDDHSSICSNILENNSTISTDNSSISSVNSMHHCASPIKSPAVDALVIASLIPSITKKTNDFEDMPPISLYNRRYDTNPVLTNEIAEMLRPYIPRRYRIAQKWDLVYSIDQHGISLATLYYLMKVYEGPCIMVIKDDKNQIFGAYLSNSLYPQIHYYGTGECFLWKFVANGKKSTPKIKAFPWTGKNDYMMLSDNNFIAIGGGNGKFGLWLNSDLDKGYSDTCPTFDNECLSIKPEFQCMEMEIWSLYL